MEDTCKELVQHADLQASPYKAEVEQLQDRVCELELPLARTELYSNLIISEVDESPSEDAKKVFLKTCQETMNVLVMEGEIVEAVRLGKQHESNANHRNRKPRPMLIKTWDKYVKANNGNQKRWQAQ